MNDKCVMFLKGASEIIVDACDKIMTFDGKLSKINHNSVLAKSAAM